MIGDENPFFIIVCVYGWFWQSQLCITTETIYKIIEGNNVTLKLVVTYAYIPLKPYFKDIYSVIRYQAGTG